MRPLLIYPATLHSRVMNKVAVVRPACKTVVYGSASFPRGHRVERWLQMRLTS